jgi:hypothetical protein
MKTKTSGFRVATFLVALLPAASPALSQERAAENSEKPETVSASPDEPKEPEKPKPDPRVLYAPSLRPDRVILTLCADPATSIGVNWRTSSEVTDPVLQFVEAQPGPHLEQNAATVPAKSEALESNLGTAHYHSVVLDGLAPRTAYNYRVGDGTNWSEWFQFRTAARESEPFSFIYFGDAQNDVRDLWSRVIRESYRQDPRAAFLLHAGDLINRAENDHEWAEWFAAGGWLNGTVPSVAVPGNHEMHKIDDNHRRLSLHWRPQFTLPENGPPGLSETCYSIRYQDTLIVALNSNEHLDVQAEWLDELLSGHTARWVVCTFHHPVFSTGKDRDNAALRALWKPVLDKHRVDLVLQGHDHTYARSGLTTPAPEWTREANAAAGNPDPVMTTGTVYVVSVSGPKMYDLQRQTFMARQAEDTQLFQVIHVDGDKLAYEAFCADGSLYDAFTLTKREGQPNQLTEQVPDRPERLRPPKPPEETDSAREASARLSQPAVSGKNAGD